MSQTIRVSSATHSYTITTTVGIEEAFDYVKSYGHTIKFLNAYTANDIYREYNFMLRFKLPAHIKGFKFPAFASIISITKDDEPNNLVSDKEELVKVHRDLVKTYESHPYRQEILSPFFLRNDTKKIREHEDAILYDTSFIQLIWAKEALSETRFPR